MRTTWSRDGIGAVSPERTFCAKPVFKPAVRKLAILIAALAVAAPIAAPAGAQAATCKAPKGYRVLVKTSRVVIFGNVGFVGTEACYLATGRRTDMFFDTSYAPTAQTGQRRLLRVNGRFIAYAFDSIDSGEDEDGSGIALVDARKGRYGVLEHDAPTSEAQFRYSRIVLRGDGVVAWSRDKRVLACDTECFKGAVAKSGDLAPGDPTVLANGSGVRPSTLERAGDRFRWRQGSGWRRSAVLR
jgi:hypothetical protein